jgi:hypothetical protein
MGPRWTGVARTECTAVPHQRAARRCWSSPVLTGDGVGGQADRGGAREVLTGAWERGDEVR